MVCMRSVTFWRLSIDFMTGASAASCRRRAETQRSLSIAAAIFHLNLSVDCLHFLLPSTFSDDPSSYL